MGSFFQPGTREIKGLKSQFLEQGSRTAGRSRRENRPL